MDLKTKTSDELVKLLTQHERARADFCHFGLWDYAIAERDKAHEIWNELVRRKQEATRGEP